MGQDLQMTERPEHDTKQSDGKASVLEIRRNVEYTIAPRMVAPDRVLSIDQIELFNILNECKQMTYVKLNC